MSNTSERVAEILKLLKAELGRLLDAVPVHQFLRVVVEGAVQQSPEALTLLNELESAGYQIGVDLNPSLWVVPVESVFVESLTDRDRAFLRRLHVKPPDQKARRRFV